MMTTYGGEETKSEAGKLRKFLQDKSRKVSAEIDAGEGVIQLSLEAQCCFAEALLKPGEPNEAMRAAFVRYHGMTREA